jgi:DNA-binding transcriptional MocR family regulator
MLDVVGQQLQGIDFIRPEGGFFLSLNLPGEVDGHALQANAEKFGIILSKGSGFFTDGRGDNFVRLPFCGMTPEEIKEGIGQLAKAIDYHRR